MLINRFLFSIVIFVSWTPCAPSVHVQSVSFVFSYSCRALLGRRNHAELQEISKLSPAWYAVTVPETFSISGPGPSGNDQWFATSGSPHRWAPINNSLRFIFSKKNVKGAFYKWSLWIIYNNTILVHSFMLYIYQIVK